MNGELVTNNAGKINQLYHEMETEAISMVHHAILIGERLAEQQQHLREERYGQWEKWIENNLDFGKAKAYAYIRLYRHQHEVLQSSVELNIKSALKLIEEPKTKGIRREPTINKVAFEIGKKLGTIYHQLLEMWEYRNQIDSNHMLLIKESIIRMHDELIQGGEDGK